jgi:hypothetical protein
MRDATAEGRDIAWGLLLGLVLGGFAYAAIAWIAL